MIIVKTIKIIVKNYLYFIFSMAVIVRTPTIYSALLSLPNQDILGGVV